MTEREDPTTGQILIIVALTVALAVLITVPIVLLTERFL